MTYIILIRPKMTFPNAMPNPPLGLGYIGGILRTHGHKVDIIDCAIIKDSYLKIMDKIKQMNPDVIGISALSPYYSQMRLLAKLLHKLKIPFILGGVHVSVLPEPSLRECGAEFIVIGEGELTILDLMDKWHDKEARKQIKGIAYLEDGHFIRNPSRELVQNLDDLPFPAWDMINPSKYPPVPHARVYKRSPFAPILTSRGCPYACAYCTSTNFWGNKFRRRSAQNIVDEIEFLVHQFGIREIHIWDDNFTLIKKHVEEFCREVLRRKLDITFACPNGIRIETLNKELLVLMRRTGFFSLHFAIESGNQYILDRVNKKMDLKYVSKIAQIVSKLGFYFASYFIFGLPGATYETERRTIEFAKSLPLNAMISFIFRPLPGSRLFSDYIQNKHLSDINYDFLHFYGADIPLEFTNGKRKLVLPKDAYREFYFRPIQIIRIIRDYVRIFHFKQLLPLLKNFYHFTLQKRFE